MEGATTAHRLDKEEDSGLKHTTLIPSVVISDSVSILVNVKWTPTVESLKLFLVRF